jgi:fructose-specific phosphotransferase system IIC component
MLKPALFLIASVVLAATGFGAVALALHIQSQNPEVSVFVLGLYGSNAILVGAIGSIISIVVIGRRKSATTTVSKN